MTKDIRRYFAAAMLLLMPMLLTGCFNKWDYTGCPVDDNFELRFKLTAADGSDLFAQKINNIDVILFDEYGYYVQQWPITRNQLAPDNSIRLTVDPGTYYVVSMANVGSQSLISSTSGGTDFYTSYVEVTSPETGEAHYGAPAITGRSRAIDPGTELSDYIVVLPAGKVVEKEFNFTRTHRTVNIYIQGAEHLDTYTGEQVNIEMKNLPYRYDFNWNTDPARKHFSRTTETVETPSGAMLYTFFSTPNCAMDNDMTIHLRDVGSNAELIDETINLKAWVEENTPEDIDEFDMLITFNKKGNDVDMTVTLANWEDIGVKPGDL